MSKEHPLRQKIARALEHLETSARAFTVAGNAILSMSDSIQKDGIWGAMQPAQSNSPATASLQQPVPLRKERSTSRKVVEKRTLLHMHLQTAMQLGDVGAVQRLSRQLDELEAQSSSTSRPQAASTPVSCERLTATSHAMSRNYAISDHFIPLVPEMRAPSVHIDCPQVAYCQRVSQGYSTVVVGCSAVSDEVFDPSIQSQPDTPTAVGISNAMCYAGVLSSRSTFEAGCLPRIEDIRTHTEACRDVCNTSQRGEHTCFVPASRTENRMRRSLRASDSPLLLHHSTKWQDEENHEEGTSAHFGVAHEAGGEPVGAVPVGIAPQVGVEPFGITPHEAEDEAGAVPVGIAPQEVAPEEGGEPVGAVPVGTAPQEGAPEAGGEPVRAVPFGIAPQVGAMTVGIVPQEGAHEAGGEPVGVAPVEIAPEVRCEDEDDDCDAPTSDVYEVETVLEMRTTDDARREFLIKWKGWSSKWNSWEPEVHILDKRLLRKFNKKKREDSAMDDLDTFNMRSKRRCAKQAAVKARQMGRQEIKEDDADND